MLKEIKRYTDKNLLTDSYILPYKSKITEGRETFYCPYIPLTIVRTKILEIKQENVYSYIIDFHEDSKSEKLLNWLTQDCRHKFIAIDKNNEVTSFKSKYETIGLSNLTNNKVSKVLLTFEDIQGSIEFKLKWF